MSAYDPNQPFDLRQHVTRDPGADWTQNSPSHFTYTEGSVPVGWRFDFTQFQMESKT